MIGPILISEANGISLIEPEIERDAANSVAWQNGPVGHETMRLMGNNVADIADVTLESSRNLITQFIEQQNEINWMIEYHNELVGSIWVHLEDSADIPAPALSFMIGNPAARGKGIAYTASIMVITWARDNGMPILYTRALTDNTPSNNLIGKLGGKTLGNIYTDTDGLKWQNYTV